MISAIGHWLYANVVGNLTASVLWATPAFLHLHWRLNRLVARKDNPGTVAGQFELSDQYDDGTPFGFRPKGSGKPSI